MVRLSLANLVQMRIKRLAHPKRGPYYNHRVPLEYQRFQKRIQPEEIIERYSQDEYLEQNENPNHMTTLDLINKYYHLGVLLPNLSNDELKKNELFQKELDRQRALVARIEKIQVVVDSVPGRGKTFMMNKNLSTPFQCAQHIGELVVSRSAVAELSPLAGHDGAAQTPDQEQSSPAHSTADITTKDSNGEEGATNGAGPLPATRQAKSVLWDMHRPLTDSCNIKFRHFDEEDVHEVNKAYWRSCSFLLGIAIRRAFKDGVKVMLHSWPRPDPTSGSFLYDVAMNLSNKWTPTDQELRAFSKLLWDICGENLCFERLDVSPKVAIEMFADNNFKLQQIKQISQRNQQFLGTDKIEIYRCGGYLELSCGPMISHTGLVGRISLASVHQLNHHIGEGESDANGLFYRFQGVSLPRELPLNSYVYQNILLQRAKKLNYSHKINE